MDAGTGRAGNGPAAEAGDGAAADRGRTAAALLTRIDRHQRLHLQQMTLGVADVRLLWLFADGRARTLREIAGALHLEQSTVNRQVNAAVTEGLLERARPGGSSAYVFTRTQKGHELFEADVAISLGGFREALDALGEPDGSEFLRLLARFAEAYREVAEGQDGARPDDGPNSEAPRPEGS